MGNRVVGLVSLIFFLVLGLSYGAQVTNGVYGTDVPREDVDLLEFPLNLEYLEAEFFLWGAFGRGLDQLAPNLTMGGPPPLGPRLAKLDPLTRNVIAQFAYQEIGHVRAIQDTVKGFPRPLLDLSVKSFATIINNAFGRQLQPPFNPYANPINYLIASYAIPYVGLRLCWSKF